MKAIIIILFFALTSLVSKGQSQLVKNFSFEDFGDPQYSLLCRYIENDQDEFDFGIAYWKNAYHSKEYGVDCSDWLDRHCDHTFNDSGYNSCSFDRIKLPSDKLVYIERKGENITIGGKVKGHFDAVRGGTYYYLMTNTYYRFRIKCKPIQLAQPLLPNGDRIPYYFTGRNALSLSLSKFGDHWDTDHWYGGQNQLFRNAGMIDVQLDDCYSYSWLLWEGTFKVADNFDELSNVILFAEDGGWAIDDVEIFEWCPENLEINNQVKILNDYAN